MKATIISDASLNSETLNAAYAFYIGSRYGKIQLAGALKCKTKITDTTELHALANALHVLFKQPYISRITKVEIYSDNICVINSLNGSSRGMWDTADREICEEIRFCMMEHCLTLGLSIRDYKQTFSFNHIKGHSGTATKHKVIQDWCDREAKKCRKLSDRLLTKNKSL